MIINKLAISLLAGAAGLFVSTADAAPLSNGTPSIANGVENVRMVCNENGRCFRERSERNVIIQQDRDAYNYAPRERYIERREYRDRQPGIGIQAPGVSLGIGGDRW
jgi:hypothetical protein